MYVINDSLTQKRMFREEIIHVPGTEKEKRRDKMIIDNTIISVFVINYSYIIIEIIKIYIYKETRIGKIFVILKIIISQNFSPNFGKIRQNWITRKFDFPRETGRYLENRIFQVEKLPGALFVGLAFVEGRCPSAW